MGETHFQITPLRGRMDLTEQAVGWFHEKWGVPAEAYRESICKCQADQVRVPQWYLVLSGSGAILGGLGVIENDFHKRVDLTPNVCAVFVEEPYRKQGIARAMLDYMCRDMENMGISVLYLLTDHTDFYEKCGWAFFGMVEDSEGNMARMYRHVMGEA